MPPNIRGEGGYGYCCGDEDANYTVKGYRGYIEDGLRYRVRTYEPAGECYIHGAVDRQLWFDHYFADCVIV
jgi:hypothetical protein